MDHDVVVREQMTERYLLDELDPDARDQFEGHFFECQECALDVRAGAAFIDHSKVVLSEEPVVSRVPTPMPSSPGWLAWLRPVSAAPALAVLLAVVGYQNFVTYPQLTNALHRPQVLAWAPLNIATYGSDGQVIAVPQGGGFGLLVRIPPDSRYTQYTADLINPAGRLELSLPIPSESVHDQRMVQIPAASREAGTYILKVHGITAAGESKEVGQSTFDLQIQK
jgi:hypothetical protein